MRHKALVIYFQTSACPFCARFEERILSPYYMRGDIDVIKVEVGPNMLLRFVDTIPAMMLQMDCLQQEFIAAGNKNADGPVVPSVKIISPKDYYLMRNMPWIPIHHIFLFPEGAETDFFNRVMREIDQHVLRRAYVQTRYAGVMR